VLLLGSILLVSWVDLEFNLVPFWGCSSLFLCALICFIVSLKPFRTRSSKIFTYFWLNCSRLNKQIHMVPFPVVAMLVFVLYSRRSFKSMKGFYSLHEVYGGQLVFFSKGLSMCFMWTMFPPFMGRFFDHSFSLMFNFRETQWV